jgi:hypothetical protein
MGVDEKKPHHGFRDKIKTMVKDAFPEAITDIKIMGGMTALETRVKKEIHDPKLFPEVDKVATVRRGLDLCPEEQAFLKARKTRARDNFAKYLGVKPEDVDPRDVPTVSGCAALCLHAISFTEHPNLSGVFRWQWRWFPCYDWLSRLLQADATCWPLGLPHLRIRCKRLMLVSCCILHLWPCQLR